MIKKNKLQKVIKAKRNKTWEENNQIIEDAYFRLLEKNKRIPTYKILSEETKISFVTLQKHLKELSYNQLKPYFRPMTKKILQRLSVQALKSGNAKEVKLYMQLIEDYREKSDVQNTIKIEDSEIVKAIEARLNIK